MRIRRLIGLWYREWTGEAAYERYLSHQRIRHPSEEPVDRAAFQARETARRAGQIRSCC